MKKNVALLAISVIVLVSLACNTVTVNFTGNKSIEGNGNVVTIERPVSGVTRVEVGNQGNLSIELGNEEKLVIEAEENLMEYILSDVSNGRLRLHTEPGVNLRQTRPILYRLMVKTLDSVTVLSSGNIEVPEIVAEEFAIEVNSSGNVKVQGVQLNSLEVTINSSGNVTIAGGSVESQEVAINSSGDYTAAQMACHKARVDITSSGNVRIQVSEKLNASLTSSGDLYYAGDPASFSVHESSSGRATQVK